MVDKRNQQLQCPYCERVFQQKERYQKHIDTKHAEDHAAAQEEAEASTSQVEVSSSKVMQVGSKAGYYTQKAPHLLLLEQCQIDRRIKPRIKVLVRHSSLVDCRSLSHVQFRTIQTLAIYIMNWGSVFGI